ncbi:MAG: magnesium-translocating P-type ATPase [Ignavibacteriales bacterium]|nr:magnesium-translocating P-type ATPase [Ignavibacteriales bacterium]
MRNFFQTNVFPKVIPPAKKNQLSSIQVSSQLIEISQLKHQEVFDRLKTSLLGLTNQEAEIRLENYGLNVVVKEKKSTWIKLIIDAVLNPLVILLSVIGIVSILTHDYETAIIIFIMVLLGLVLRFVQEYKADNAAAKLKAMIHVTATVIRNGIEEEIPLSKLVPGDIVKLSAGDMIPADLRILSSKDLFIIQSALTGESIPVEKFETNDDSNSKSSLEIKNICFLGTSVESGSATGIVVTTGANTYLGKMASAITTEQVQTSFDKGVKSFTWLMIKFMMVMVPLVFLINGLTKHNWHEAFFFALAVAVGLTPEMLPMIVTVCLSKGAMAMSKKKVIMKRLNAIQNLGAMDVLCTDKTGTLTIDKVILEKHCDVVRKDDEGVLQMAYLNSYFQTGLKNILDRAILVHKEAEDELHIANYKKVDEIPFDFSRKIMSVVVETPNGVHQIITKGAPEEIFSRCTHFELDGEILPVESVLISDLKEEYDDLSKDGFRVLALAYKDLEKKEAYNKDDESNLTLIGYLAFLDPPKETAAAAIVALQNHGISIKVITGDNELVTMKVCKEVGISTDKVLLGTDTERMTDDELSNAVDETTIFARHSPTDKQKIVKILQKRGHTVGFLGDGMNDAPALRVADVGISVDSAVDIAKETADVILLKKSLMVLEEGVQEGRKVFANILKYIRMGASSNFGNMFSVLGASIILPFLPMMPIQILANNLLYDFSQVPIPTDGVDPELIAKPRPWSMGAISKFILFIGPISSIFDYATFFIMLYVFGCWDLGKSSLFQTGWFVESLLTQTLIIHVIRTNKIPFIQSRASIQLIATTFLIMIIGIWLPFSPFAKGLSLVALPALYWPLLAMILISYLMLTQFVKVSLIKRFIPDGF